MVEISHRERVVRAKIIYYGPAAGGKTTNILVLHRRADPKRRGEMVSVNSAQDRTILLDLLPVKTPAFRGYELRFQVIAVPGQPMYAASRKLLLNGADAVVFVANSASDRWGDTIQSLQEMNQNLISHGLDPSTMPVVFQYNKRDLPDVTPMDAMDKTLNARRTKSFSAVAIREEGVLETFAAALSLTLRDLTTRYNLGDRMPATQSVDDWVETSMRAIFEPETQAASEPEEPTADTSQADASHSLRQPEDVEDEPTESVSVDAAATTSELNAPALQALEPTPEYEDNEEDPSVPSIELIEEENDYEEKEPPDEDGDQPVPEPEPVAVGAATQALARNSNAGRVLVTVPVASELAGSPSAATHASDPAVEQSLVESYALAAANLTSALEEMRDQKDTLERRLEELSAPIDTAQELLMGAPAHQVLKRGLLRIGNGLGSDVCSLALMRPDSRLEPVILNRLEVDPLFFTLDVNGRPLAESVLEHASPVIYIYGEDGPLGEALKRAGDRFTSLVSIPVTSQVRPLGLATFYLPPETAPPPEGAMTHLARLGQGLALAMELVSGALASERLQNMEKNATVGQISEQALLELGPPIDRMFAHVGRLRGRDNAPMWLIDELRSLVLELTRAKQFRDGVLGFMAGHSPGCDAISLVGVFEQVRLMSLDDLQRAGIRLEVDSPDEDYQIQVDAFLLRCALSALVDQARTELSGHQGGTIRLSASKDGDDLNIRVSDNLSAVRSQRQREALPDYLSWALERKVKGWRFALVRNLAEYFQGKWLTKQNNEGNEITLIIPAAQEQ